jgi:uncharacterized membrane protein
MNYSASDTIRGGFDMADDWQDTAGDLVGKTKDFIGGRGTGGGSAQGDHEMLVVAFDDAGAARQVLDTMKQLESRGAVALKSAAVVERDPSGKVDVEETNDFDAKQGAIAGAVAGGLIGLLTGRTVGGALVGTAGGALASKAVDLGIDDDFLEEVGASLSVGGSAIVAMIDIRDEDAAMQELDRIEGGTILTHGLSDDVYQRLSDAVED